LGVSNGDGFGGRNFDAEVVPKNAEGKKMKSGVSLKNIFLGHWPVLILVLIWLWLVVVNFRGDAWLSGWDNLHPEFNFSLNIERTLQAAWQEYRGLGHADGMAQAADLTRQLLLSVVDLVIPTQHLRYVWWGLMLLSGPLGAYVLATYVGKRKTDRAITPWPGLVAGAYYLLNIAMVQYFFTPFEPFLSFYGFLPWLLWAVVGYLDTGKRARLGTLALVLVLATSAFLVQTLFIVFVMIVGLFVTEALLRQGMKGLRRAVVAGGLIVVVNSFWLLPAGYFALTQAEVVAESKGNRISTGDMQYLNRAFGGFEEVISLYGFQWNIRIC
jgi:hypothetical protein